MLEPLKEERAEMLKQATEMCDVIKETIVEANKRKEALERAHFEIREKEQEQRMQEQRYRESESHRDRHRGAWSGGNE